MCKYSQRTLYPGCLHVVDTLAVAPERRTVLEVCAAHRAVLDGNAAFKPACRRVDLAHGVVLPVVGEAEVVCSDCLALKSEADAEWAALLRLLHKVGARAAAGAFEGPGSEATAEDGTAIAVPSVLRRLPPVRESYMAYLESMRAVALAPRPGPGSGSADNVFRTRCWSQLRFYQRLLVYCFATRRSMPAWADAARNFGLNAAAWAAVDRVLRLLVLVQNYRAVRDPDAPKDRTIELAEFPAQPRPPPLLAFGARDGATEGDSGDSDSGSSSDWITDSGSHDRSHDHGHDHSNNHSHDHDRSRRDRDERDGNAVGTGYGDAPMFALYL